MGADALPLAGAPLPMQTAQPRTDQPRDELHRVASEFESIFLAQMLAPMFEGLSTDGLGGGGMGEEMFRPMLIERYAQALSKSGGVGIADNIIAELARMQTVHQENPDGADR